MPHIGEPGVRGDLLGPPLNGLALDLDAPPAVPADQVVMVGVAAAPSVEGLAAGVPDRIDTPVLAEHLQVPVHGGQPDILAAPPELGMDLLRAGESGHAIESRGDRLSLSRAPNPGPAGRRRSGRRCTHTRTVAALPASFGRARRGRRPHRARPKLAGRAATVRCTHTRTVAALPASFGRARWGRRPRPGKSRRT